MATHGFFVSGWPTGAGAVTVVRVNSEPASMRLIVRAVGAWAVVGETGNPGRATAGDRWMFDPGDHCRVCAPNAQAVEVGGPVVPDAGARRLPESYSALPQLPRSAAADLRPARLALLPYALRRTTLVCATG